MGSPELLKEKNENIDSVDEMEKRKRKISDKFEERNKNKNVTEGKIIIKPKFEKSQDDAIKEEDEDIDGIEVKDRKKINDEFKERKKIKKDEEEKIIIKPNIGILVATND